MLVRTACIFHISRGCLYNQKEQQRCSFVGKKDAQKHRRCFGEKARWEHWWPGVCPARDTWVPAGLWAGPLSLLQAPGSLCPAWLGSPMRPCFLGPMSSTDLGASGHPTGVMTWLKEVTLRLPCLFILRLGDGLAAPRPCGNSGKLQAVVRPVFTAPETWPLAPSCTRG